jgi:hypothetical protein
MGHQTKENARMSHAVLVAQVMTDTDLPTADRSHSMTAADAALLMFKASPA